MGEKIAPASSSAELPWVDALRDALEHTAPPILSPIADVSDPSPATSPTNGNGAGVRPPVDKAYLEQIIENAPEAISIIDSELGILRINGEFTRLFGFTAEEAAGRRINQLIVPPDRYAETAWIAERIQTENKLSLETRRKRKDGSLVEVLVSAAPVMVNGQRVGAYASYRDITEQKRTEELNAALYAIAARSQSAEDLQQFFAAIHNIVGQLMNARNFYIALYDPQAQLLSFPYFVDEEDPTPAPKTLGRGLTEYVLRSGEPLLATPAVFEELMRRGEVESIGTPSLAARPALESWWCRPTAKTSALQSVTAKF
jgi:PAS domain S-box-containing protein